MTKFDDICPPHVARAAAQYAIFFQQGSCCGKINLLLRKQYNFIWTGPQPEKYRMLLHRLFSLDDPELGAIAFWCLEAGRNQVARWFSATCALSAKIFRPFVRPLVAQKLFSLWDAVTGKAQHQCTVCGPFQSKVSAYDVKCEHVDRHGKAWSEMEASWNLLSSSNLFS